MRMSLRSFGRRCASLLPTALSCSLMLAACAAPALVQGPAAAPPAPQVANQASTLNGSAPAAPNAEAQDRPRVMVVVKAVPRNDIVAVNDEMLDFEPTEALLAEALRARGFPVVEPATVRLQLGRDQLRLILEGDNQAAGDVGRRAGADMVLAGAVQQWTEPQPASGAAGAPASARVRLDARAVNAASGEVRGTALIELDAPHGIDAALQRASDSAAAELSAPMLSAWRGRTTIIEIYADDADDQRVQLLRSAVLNEANGVDSVVTRSLTDRMAVIEVFSSLPVDELLARIDRCTTAVPFAVRGVSENRIDIRFLDQPEECKPDLK